MSEGELGNRLLSARAPPCLLTGWQWVRGRGVGRGLPGSLRLGVFPSTGPGPWPGEQALTHIPTVPRQKVGQARSGASCGKAVGPPVPAQNFQPGN